MGYREDVMALDLSDDIKQQLIQSHESEVNPLKDSHDQLAARARRTTVENEVKELAALFSDDNGNHDVSGLLKFTRRVLLSADTEEPGAVLLSDSELNLSGDEATGATGREEASVAGVLREFISLLPRNDKGRLAVNLSDQAHRTDTGDERPESGERDEEAEREQRVARLSGRKVNRTRKRYGGATAIEEGV